MITFKSITFCLGGTDVREYIFPIRPINNYRKISSHDADNLARWNSPMRLFLRRARTCRAVLSTPGLCLHGMREWAGFRFISKSFTTSPAVKSSTLRKFSNSGRNGPVGKNCPTNNYRKFSSHDADNLARRNSPLSLLLERSREPRLPSCPLDGGIVPAWDGGMGMVRVSYRRALPQAQ